MDTLLRRSRTKISRCTRQRTRIYKPSRELWPGASVNARVAPIETGRLTVGEARRCPAARWIDENRCVDAHLGARRS